MAEWGTEEGVREVVRMEGEVVGYRMRGARTRASPYLRLRHTHLRRRRHLHPYYLQPYRHPAMHHLPPLRYLGRQLDFYLHPHQFHLPPHPASSSSETLQSFITR